MDGTKSLPAEATELATALKLVVGRIARRVRQARTEGDLTLSETSVLARLERDGPDSPGSLAELERVRPQAMASTLAALEERGLVSRRRDPEDGRRVVMTVTGTGRRLLADRRSDAVRLLATALDREFTVAERRRIQAVIPLLDRLAERL
ncbi:MAG TPA: MarR family transcriptional regulator [Rugosimonospora sp.]|nr:MarR family transcriptional regulator [Rugosimonospora sp.]